MNFGNFGNFSGNGARCRRSVAAPWPTRSPDNASKAMTTRGDENRTRWETIARDDAHRPWPPPDRPWSISQTWSDLLFAHWPVPTSVLRPKVPAGLELDTFDGEAWIAIVPFRMSNVAFRRAPRRQRLVFPELNVRTYVVAGDKPGVWFFSLDAASTLAVATARAVFHLPYFRARMHMRDDEGWIGYSSDRFPGAPGARFAGRYQPTGPVYQSAPGTLEHWLTERYCLYAASRTGRIFRGEINHGPWPLQSATAEVAVNTMTAAHGISLSGPPLLHFTRRIDMVAWWPERVRNPREDSQPPGWR